MSEVKTGKFSKNLIRSNQKLREDRALIIVRDTEKVYRRNIEDLQDELERLIIDRDNALDINPGNTQTIINPSDFNSKAFVDKDIDFGIKIRNTKIKLEDAKQRYADLFDGKIEE